VALVIRNGLVLSLTSPDSTPALADLRVENGRIAALGGSVPAEPADEVVDARGCLVMPGFVNAHVHSWELPFRGRYDNLPLELWTIYAYPPFGYPPLSERLIYLRTMMVALESLRNGVTSIVDDLPELPSQTLASLGAAFAAYADAGINASVSGNIGNLPFTKYLPFAEEVIPAAYREQVESFQYASVDEYLGFCREAVKLYHRPEAGSRFVVAPVAPQWCSDDLLQGALEFAEQEQLACHTHVLETSLQAAAADLFFGKSMIEYLDDLGCLTPRMSIIHAVWVTASDIAIIAARGCPVILNPISNLKLGAGIAPFRRLVEAGIPVGLGSDGVSTSDTTRMLDVARAVALLGKVVSPQYDEWPSAGEALHAATAGGAHAAGMGQETGTLEVGKRADLVLIRRDSLSFTPTNTLVNHLVHAENGSSIERVYVAGRCVVEQGRTLLVDEQALRAEFAQEMVQFQQDHQEIEDQVRPLERYLNEIYRRSLQLVPSARNALKRRGLNM
jgi:cytosine/adenosine deaminase-related metal-dependent hydrolase